MQSEAVKREDDLTYTVDELSELFGVVRTTAYNWAKNKYRSEVINGTLYCYLSQEELNKLELAQSKKKKIKTIQNNINLDNNIEHNTNNIVYEAEYIKTNSGLSQTNSKYNSNLNNINAGLNSESIIEAFKTVQSIQSDYKELAKLNMSIAEELGNKKKEVMLLEDSERRKENDYIKQINLLKSELDKIKQNNSILINENESLKKENTELKKKWWQKKIL